MKKYSLNNSIWKSLSYRVNAMLSSRVTKFAKDSVIFQVTFLNLIDEKGTKRSSVWRVATGQEALANSQRSNEIAYRENFTEEEINYLLDGINKYGQDVRSKVSYLTYF